MKTVKYVGIESNVPADTMVGPVQTLTSDGYYWVKYYDSFQFGRPNDRYKELINEFVCAELAMRLSLPLPEPALVVIEKDVGAEYQRDNQTVHLSQSVNFGSRNLEGVLVNPIVDASVRGCSNPQEILPIMVFDAWVHNVDRDRNSSNCLINVLDGSIHIIDQGNVFGAGTCWDKYSLGNDQLGLVMVDAMAPDGLYSRFLENLDLRRYREKTRERFERIDYNVIDDILSRVPEKWNLDPEDKKALHEYLFRRLGFIEDYIDLIFQRGGTKK